MLAGIADRGVHHGLDFLWRQVARQSELRRNRDGARIEALADGTADILPRNAQPVEVTQTALLLAEQILVDASFIDGAGRCADQTRCVLRVLRREALAESAKVIERHAAAERPFG